MRKKLPNNPCVFMLVMALTSLSLLFGIFFGPEHPQIFFWSFMIVLAIAMALYAFTNIKDVAILIGGVAVLCVWMSVADKYILCHLTGWAHLIVGSLLAAPIYITTALHFVKMVKNRQKKDKEE